MKILELIKLNKGNIRMAIIFFLAIALVSCNSEKEPAQKEKKRIIFDTDMGNDIDDALALAMLNNYIDQGLINLMAVVSSKDNPYSAKYIDILNTWYGHPNVPLGIVVDGKEPGKPTFTKHCVELEKDGEPVFKKSVSDYSSLPDAVSLYRKLLAGSPDSSVVIITVGFSTNIARLLDSDPDSFSPLSGSKLVSQKVDYLCMMAGGFTENPRKEYNVFIDCPAAAKVFNDWPTPIVTSPFEVGLAAKYPSSSIENDFNDVEFHPLVEAYKSYSTMPYDRPTWDLTSVLHVVEMDSSFFSVSPRGKITIDTLTSISHFEEIVGGKHTYLLMDDKQAERVKKRLIELVAY